MRVAGLIARGWIGAAVLSSCGPDMQKVPVTFTAEADRADVAQATGTWEGEGLIIEICDDRTKAFCATNPCKRQPCHDLTRDGKDETVTAEHEVPGSATDSGCADTCDTCECSELHSGLMVTARVSQGGYTTAFAGTAEDGRDTARSRTSRGQWSLVLDNTTGVSTIARQRWAIVNTSAGDDRLQFEHPDAGSYLDVYDLKKTKSGERTCP